MNCLPTHTSTVINPLPSPCSISPPLPRPTTPLSKVMLSSTRCDFHCSTTVQIHPPPFVMSFHVLLKRSNKWDVLHLLIHLRKILHAVSKECKHFFFFHFQTILHKCQIIFFCKGRGNSVFTSILSWPTISILSAVLQHLHMH